MASLFETGFNLSAAPVSDGASRKRKRNDDDADKEGLVAAASINVEKLLNKLRASEKASTPAKDKLKNASKGKDKAEVATARAGRPDKQKKRKDRAKNRDGGARAASPPKMQSAQTAAAQPDETKKERKRKRKDKHVNGTAITAPADGAAPAAQAAQPPPPASSGFDGLRDQMRAKLGGSRFRYINEQLYTVSGDEAQRLMDDDPDVFKEYHAGFRSQSDRWPTHPLHLITADLKRLPQRSIVADLGCGDATLAKSLNPTGLRVLSYDLVGDGEVVVKAQCSKHIPLPNAVVDAVVCCLSLMGQDWLGMVMEARRILTADGRLKIAEVTSRFSDVDAFVSLIERAGFELTSKDDSNTHFILFDLSAAEPSPAADDSITAASLLKPCIYKKR